MLRERGEWGRLLSLLQEWTAAATDPDEIRRAHLNTARLLIEQRGDREAARTHLEQVLNVAPQDREALLLILPILEEQRDIIALTQRLASAADATNEPVRRAEFLYRLAMARTSAPHSATAQFFINTTDNGFLDFKSETPQGWGYAVFGKVVAGQDVVDAIEGARTGRRGMHDDVPLEDVVIQKVVEVA